MQRFDSQLQLRLKRVKLDASLAKRENGIQSCTRTSNVDRIEFAVAVTPKNRVFISSDIKLTIAVFVDPLQISRTGG